MDLVLFVRHGSFYNLFNVDADVGLRVGLNLSGAAAANMWKVGCFKDHFAVWAAKVGGYCPCGWVGAGLSML
jgi:hypothetical protein